MEDIQEIDEIVECFKSFNLTIDRDQADKLYRYYLMLVQANEEFNLTSITGFHEVLYKHFLDSAFASNLLPLGARVADVGTGAGFPGMVLAIIRPDLNITLVDSLSKRTNFLIDVSVKLEISNVSIIHARAEDFGRMDGYRESFDYVTSRALAPMRTLLEYDIPLLRVGGMLLAFKGANVEEELNLAQNAFYELRCKVTETNTFSAPGYFDGHKILTIKKLAPTIQKYPRLGNKPKTNPL